MLKIDSNEIPVVGAKASGVKGINLKDDKVVTCMSPEPYDEYIAVFTNNNTSKRIKIAELDTMTRAKKGSTIIKKVKSKNYEITNAISVNNHDTIGIKTDDEIKELKSTELPIMDLPSTGSLVSKTNIEATFKVSELVERKLDNNESSEPLELVENKAAEKIPSNNTVEELTIDDFIDDFKL